MFINSLNRYNPTFRGTALAQKTQVTFFAFWWKNVFSAVSPEKSATRSGWITWCSYLSPWRQQPTKVTAPKWDLSSALLRVWKPSKHRSCSLVPAQFCPEWTQPTRCLDCSALLTFSQSPCTFLLRGIPCITDVCGGVMDGTYLSACAFDQVAGLTSA